ncbi:hypothetical protein Rhal01_02251 [Rubritalea halochordaticola]|uniref:SGNH hydrolase-type esterase domain-containing protein n=1 Tax=Rubritalea halochordaticola TaxID=714537 RepID=A0ABP9V259_9BACT
MKALFLTLILATPLLAQVSTEVAKSRSTVPAERTDKWAPSWKERHELLVKRANTNTKDYQLVFVGDSITHSWERAGKKVWADNFAKFGALNLGIGGDRTEHVLWRLQNGAWPKDLKPKVAVVMIGTNNTGFEKGQPAEETAAGIQLIIDEIHQRSPETQIILHAIFPRGANPKDGKRVTNNKINTLISKLGERDYVHYADIGNKFLDPKGQLPKVIMPDRLHPNARGYQIWATALKPELEKLGLK